MRKPTFCKCEDKDADQIRGDREADQRPMFSLHRHYNPSTLKIRNLKPLVTFCSCTAWFVSDRVGNQNVGFLMMRLNFDSMLLFTTVRVKNNKMKAVCEYNGLCMHWLIDS